MTTQFAKVSFRVICYYVPSPPVLRRSIPCRILNLRRDARKPLSSQSRPLAGFRAVGDSFESARRRCGRDRRRAHCARLKGPLFHAPFGEAAAPSHRGRRISSDRGSEFAIRWAPRQAGPSEITLRQAEMRICDTTSVDKTP
jgi:hypothetical protein